jgi:hypothetical protein
VLVFTQQLRSGGDAGIATTDDQDLYRFHAVDLRPQISWVSVAISVTEVTQ